MREQATIDLDEPLVGHDGPIKRVVLREPTFDEYLSVGDPWSIAATDDGETRFAVENPEVIKQYIALCLVEPKNPDLLKQGNARLARAVKEKILGFFRVDAATEPSASSQTNSSSADRASAPAKSKR